MRPSVSFGRACGLGVLVIATLLAPRLAAPAWAGQTWTEHKLDDTFRKYSKRFFGPGYDWRLFKAQAIAESRLKPDAVSGRGARGVMQILPATYREVQLRNPDFGDLDDPEWNIAAGIFYQRQQWEFWQAEAERAHQNQFMLASYNAGRTTLLRAQRLAEARHMNYRRWPVIAQIAPLVPLWRHRETLEYVDRIETTVRAMDRQGRVLLR